MVSKDEKDSSGVRALLNLGHTFGHVIELHMGFGTWLHGEAVSVGIAMAFDLSLRHGWVDIGLVERVHAILTQARLPITLPSKSINITSSEFMQAMKSDKKAEGGHIKLVLPRGPLGTCELTSSINTHHLMLTLNKYIKTPIEGVH